MAKNSPLQLRSDFRDWYDAAFDREGPVFERLSRGGMSRRQMLSYMSEVGLCVPRHGLVCDLVPAIMEDFADWPEDSREAMQSQILELVVYHDEQAHAGEGKEKVAAAEALARYSDLYASEFIPATPSGVGVSLRYLQVGKRRWWLRYWSQDDWRSNAGQGGCEVLCEEKPGRPYKIDAPMFAVDFVRAGTKLYAIDFNIAPGLVPLNGRLRASEVVEQLCGH
jgi:hypothetical protein